MVTKQPSQHKDNLAELARSFPGLGDLTSQVGAETLRVYHLAGRAYLTWCAFDTDRARNPQTLRAWRDHLVQEGRLSPQTINGRLAAIRSLISVSAACGAVPPLLSAQFALVEAVTRSAVRHRLKPEQHRRYTPQNVCQLCRAPDPQTLVGLRDRALLTTLASSGCRIAEVVGLQREHLRVLETGYGIQVLGNGQPPVRLVPLNREAYDGIHRWLTARDQRCTSPWIFTGFGTHGRVPTTRPLTGYQAWHIVKQYARRIGLPHLTPHDLRRVFGLEIVERCGLQRAQQVLGHRSVTTTRQFYAAGSIAVEGGTYRLKEQEPVVPGDTMNPAASGKEGGRP